MNLNATVDAIVFVILKTNTIAEPIVGKFVGEPNGANVLNMVPKSALTRSGTKPWSMYSAKMAVIIFLFFQIYILSHSLLNINILQINVLTFEIFCIFFPFPHFFCLHLVVA